jgi:hypothetical protein
VSAQERAHEVADRFGESCCNGNLPKRDDLRQWAHLASLVGGTARYER